MQEAHNQAAKLIVSAQSVIKDLTTQIGELTKAVESQQDLIVALTPQASWTEFPEEAPEEHVEGVTP